MNYLIKGGIATLSIGTIGGGSYVGYLHFSKNSFADKLEISILNLTGDDNSNIWGERLKELNSKSTGLDATLSKLKNKQWKDLQNWCNSNQNNAFSNESDLTYSNFKDFCTWKVGDKEWTNKIAASNEEDNENWKKAHEFLKQTNKAELSKKLQAIYDKTDTKNENKKAMHKWCTENYKKVWTGENDSTLKEVKKYCKSA